MNERVCIMVSGSRDWPYDEWMTVYDVLDEMTHRCGYVFELVHGGAKGPDSWAAAWADDFRGASANVRCFPPDYDRYGKRAPHVRNDAMLAEATHLVAFWDGKSRGTRSVLKKAMERGLSYEVYSPAGVDVSEAVEAMAERADLRRGVSESASLAVSGGVSEGEA